MSRLPLLLALHALFALSFAAPAAYAGADSPTVDSFTPHSVVAGVPTQMDLEGSGFLTGDPLFINATTEGVVITDVAATPSTLSFMLTAPTEPLVQSVTLMISSSGSTEITVIVTPPAMEPVVSEFAPTSVTAGEPTEIVVMGENFRDSLDEPATVIPTNGAVLVTDVVVDPESMPGTLVFTITAPIDPLMTEAELTIVAMGSTSFSIGVVQPLPPAVSSVAPTQLRRGVTTEVIVRGQAFPEAMTVELAGTGITVSDAVRANDTLFSFDVGTSATAELGERTLSFTGVTLDAQTLTVVPGPPDLLSVTPNAGARGDLLTLTIAGANLDVVTALDFGEAVTVTNWDAISPTRGTATIEIGAGARSGFRSIEATTATGRATLPAGFEVTGGVPVITEINPSSAERGETIGVLITGENIDQLDEIGFGPRIGVEDFEVISPTEATVTVSVRQDTTAGPRGITFSEGEAQTTVPAAFTVRRGAIVVDEIRPNRVEQQDETFITFEGENLDGLTSFDAGPGVTVTNINANLPTSVSVDVIIAPDAAVGLRDVTLVAPAGTLTIEDGLIVAPYVRPQPDLRFTARVEVETVQIGGTGRAAIAFENRGELDETITLAGEQGDLDMFRWIDADGRLLDELTLTVASGATETAVIAFVPSLRGRRSVRYTLVFADDRVTTEYSIDAFGSGASAELLLSQESPADFGTLDAEEPVSLPRIFTRLADNVEARESIVIGYEIVAFQDDVPYPAENFTVDFFSTQDALYWGLTEMNWSVVAPPGEYTGRLSVVSDNADARYRELEFSFAVGSGGADAGGDAGDVGPDVGGDAGTDVGEDAGSDTEGDAGADVTPDADPDSGTDTIATDAGNDGTATDTGTEDDGGEESGGGDGGGCSAGLTSPLPAFAWLLLILAPYVRRNRRA